MVTDIAMQILAVPDITPQAPPGADKVLNLMGWLKWGVFLAGVGALLFAGGKFGWEKWNGHPIESPKLIAGAAIGGVVAASASVIMNTVTA
ncbi:hypothetical protein [Tomitella gaofuii]|uniref:hypothetical protein n=1 Tax=Tomitella gaofuii TaxID=2760083 RepID=UPI0015F95661|nr:hypothetical protein [Tomitella gaofuii]